METFYEVMRRKGISRRSFLKYCSLTPTSLGLAPSFVPQIAPAMENKPRFVLHCVTQPKYSSFRATNPIVRVPIHHFLPGACPHPLLPDSFAVPSRPWHWVAR